MERVVLDFERPIVEIEHEIEELRQLHPTRELAAEIEKLEHLVHSLCDTIFADLTPWQKVQLSRHALRPYTLDYAQHLLQDFVEVHGDRRFGDDAAIVTGFGRFQLTTPSLPIAIVGHQKGRTTKENVLRNFGMPRPEGYRKAKRVMELAARFGRPIVTFIDTPGAYPGIDAEERGQAEAIASNLECMAALPVPIIACVVGEGGSGGALAIGVADRILMLEHATYAVISPEGCASILWRDQSRAADAAAAMRMDAASIAKLGVIDEVVSEPPGGAHRDHQATARRIGGTIAKHLAELRALAPRDLLEQRYLKYRRMGAFAGS